MSYTTITVLPNGNGYTLFTISSNGIVWAYNSQRRCWIEHSRLPK